MTTGSKNLGSFIATPPESELRLSKGGGQTPQKAKGMATGGCMGVAFDLESSELLIDETPPMLVVTRAAQWTGIYSKQQRVSLISINKTSCS
jgi:hypothetical protein